MRLLLLAALLPLLAAAPSPYPIPGPYNPIFPSNSTLSSPSLFSHDQLASRADLEAKGRDAMAQAVVHTRSFGQPLGASHNHVKRGKREGKTGPLRKIRRTRSCSVPTSSAKSIFAPVEPTATSSSSVKETLVPAPTAGSTTKPIVPSSSTKAVTPSTPAIQASSTKSYAPSSYTGTAVKSTPTRTSTHSVAPSSTKTTQDQSSSATNPSSTTHTTTALTTTTSTHSTASPSPSSTTGDFTVDRDGNGPFSGWGTWFDDGLGACGWTNSAADPIVAVSAQLFDNWPTWNGLNPNENPICGHHIEISWGGKSLVVEVADRCPGCDVRSLDMSVGTFEHFATLGVGLLGKDSYTGNISWSWVEGSGPLSQVPVT